MSMRFMIQQSDLLKNRIDSLVGGRGGGGTIIPACDLVSFTVMDY